MRTVLIGLLGLGRVGGAVVRSAGPAAPWIASTGLTFVFERALVRALALFHPGAAPFVEVGPSLLRNPGVDDVTDENMVEAVRVVVAAESRDLIRRRMVRVDDERAPLSR